MGQSTPPAGSPATISKDDHRHLLQLHMQKIREANTKVELARAPFDAARDDLTAVIDDARADLGKKLYPRKRLMSYLEDLGSRLRNLLAEEQQRHQDRIDLGLPVHGEQLSLALGDPAMPQEKKDEQLWEAEGFMLGRAGKLNVIPEGCPTRFHQLVMKAAEKGQELTRAEVQAGMELRQKRSQPDASAKTVDLSKTEPTEAQKEAAIKASEKLARESLGAPAPGAKGPKLAAVGGDTRTVRTEESAAA